MSTARTSFTLVSLLLFSACGGSDGAPGSNGAAGAPGAAGQNGAPGQNGGQGDAGSPPAHAPQAVTFFDVDPSTDAVQGTIVVQHAADESDIASYAVYFGKSATVKLDLTPVFSEAAEGANVTFPLTMSAIPAGATFLLAAAENAAGESAIVATPLVDRVPAHVDISAGAGTGSGFSPSLAIDATNGKLLVATDDGANSHKPGLSRCNLDATSCAHLDISASAGANSGTNPSLAIDAANGKLLVATEDASEDASEGDRPALFRCNLDGNSCAHFEIPIGSAISGGYPSLALDPASGAVFAAIDDGANLDKSGLVLLR